MAKNKITSIRDLIGRHNGATITEIQRRTGWKAPSVRAAISSLRRDGVPISLATLPRGRVYRVDA